MFEGKLYSVECAEVGRAVVRLNAECEIYRVHFVGNPITPGVCIVRMVQEAAERERGVRLRLAAARNIKYLAPILPDATPRVELLFSAESAEDNRLAVKATLQWGETVFARLSLIFVCL